MSKLKNKKQTKKPKQLTILGIDKDVEQLDFSYIIARNKNFQ